MTDRITSREAIVNGASAPYRYGMIETSEGARRQRHPRVLSVPAALVCGVVAGPLFVITFLVAGVIKPDYSPLKHDVSALELGDFGWIQSLNFVVTGLLTLAFAAGLRRELNTEKGTKWGPRLIGLWAIGLVGSGIFITDPIGGYPPGSPVEGGEVTGHGVLHNICAGLSFISLLAAIILFTRVFAARRQRAWAFCSILCGTVLVVAIIVASYGASRTGGVAEVDGLYQRIAGSSGMVWLTTLALNLLRRRSAKPVPVRR
jgi:hypothetical membrane protein